MKKHCIEYTEKPKMPFSKEEKVVLNDKYEEERRIAEYIGLEIKKIRVNEKISRHELAKKLGCSSSTIQRLEEGKILKLNYLMLRNIANELHVNQLAILGSDLNDYPYVQEFLQYMPLMNFGTMADSIYRIGGKLGDYSRMSYCREQLFRLYADAPLNMRNYIIIKNEINRTEENKYEYEVKKKLPDTVQKLASIKEYEKWDKEYQKVLEKFYKKAIDFERSRKKDDVNDNRIGHE